MTLNIQGITFTTFIKRNEPSERISYHLSSSRGKHDRKKLLPLVYFFLSSQFFLYGPHVPGRHKSPLS